MVKVKFTLEELKEAVREHGVSLIEDVDLAILETDGNISIISNDFKNKTVNKRKLRGRTTIQAAVIESKAIKLVYTERYERFD